MPRQRDETSHKKFVSAADIALVHLGLGETDQALELLERSVEERAHQMVCLKTDPRFDPLRTEPRFQRLIRTINFPD